ncbi:MAG: hypothetical protein ACD_45C00704G0001 [uncultured bacterium]|nr:MAG: hypothetical protein ACD_45C00704G0001 [uncultured bacterium]
MEAPINIKPIPAQVINEQASYGAFDLKEFFQATDGMENVQFSAELSSGTALPKGLICTADGILTGIPAKGTEGLHEVIITATNAAGTARATFTFTIKPTISTDIGYIDKLKAQVWQALGQNQPIPELQELLDRAVSPLDIYYLLERWGTLTVYDAFNLDPPGVKTELKLAGQSQHFHVYDRGSCLVAVPKDLFSLTRTLEDGLQTVRAMMREIYQRGWTVELVGFDKYRRVAWNELQHLGDKYSKHLDVINYNPSLQDVQLYSAQATLMNMNVSSTPMDE